MSRALLIIKISVFLIFIGRAWQHIFWDAPYRSFFWDESLLKPIIEKGFDMPWQEYATSPATDYWIQQGIKTNGFLYLIAALSVVLLRKKNYKWFRIPIIAGGISLVLLAVLLTKEKFYHTAQFFEHSIQFGTPFLLLACFKKKLAPHRLIFALKILIALTFLSHGLYAVGTYPVPGKFIDMVISIFGCSENISIAFLYVAGILDFIVAILIFVPRVQSYALWYAIGWGILTALARVFANFYVDFPWQSIHQHLYQTLYRLPHGLAPFAVLLWYRYQQKKTAPKDSLLTNLKT